MNRRSTSCAKHVHDLPGRGEITSPTRAVLANGRILEQVRGFTTHLGVPLVNRIEHSGNTSSAYIPWPSPRSWTPAPCPARAGSEPSPTAPVRRGAGSRWTRTVRVTPVAPWTGAIALPRDRPGPSPLRPLPRPCRVRRLSGPLHDRAGYAPTRGTALTSRGTTDGIMRRHPACTPARERPHHLVAPQRRRALSARGKGTGSETCLPVAPFRLAGGAIVVPC